MFRKALLSALFLCLGAWGQTPAPVVPPTPTSTNWYGAGAAFNPSATPAGSGWGAYGKQVNEKVGLWQFDIYFAGPQKVAGKETVVTSTTAGFAMGAKSIGPFQIFAFGTAGVATSGSNTGNAFPWGGFIDYKVKKGPWHIDAGYMLVPSSLPVKTQRVYLIGAGRTF